MSQVIEAGGPKFNPPRNTHPPSHPPFPQPSLPRLPMPFHPSEVVNVCPLQCVCIYPMHFRLNIWIRQKWLQWVSPALDWRGLGAVTDERLVLGTEEHCPNVINVKNCIWIIVFKYLDNLSKKKKKSQRWFFFAGISFSGIWLDSHHF